MQKMPDSKKELVQNMNTWDLMSFQLRLQIKCDMTDQEAADYIAKAFEEVQP